MPVPTFDESTRAEKLPQEVFRWLKEAAMYARSTPDSADEVYDALKLLLRLLAVRNPDSQSHATRQALGSLIESIYMQPNCDKILLDLLALLIRMVDAKQLHRYNAMKHLAIAGLGHLARYLSVHMRQMSANVFIICLDSLKICPVQPDTHRYRNTLLWALRESATTTVDEPVLKSAFKSAKLMVESSGSTEIDIQTTVRGFKLMAVLLSLPAAKSMEKKLDSVHSLFLNYGISSLRKEIRIAAAEFYCSAIISLSPHDLRHDMTSIVNATLKLQASKHLGYDPITSAKLDGYSILLKKLLEHYGRVNDFEAHFEEWVAPLLLQLNPSLAKSLLVHGVLRQKLDGYHTGVDILAVLVRQLALSRAQPSQRSASSKSKSVNHFNPLTESALACLTDTITILGSSIQPSATSIHQATLGLIFNGTEPLSNEQLGWCILCLISIIRSSPPLLISTIEVCLKQLEFASNSLRKVEIAYVIGAMVSESKNFSLYGDVDLNNRVILLAFDHIKKRDDLASYKAGWALMSGALCLGSEVVKPVASQLLLLWETHLSSEACKYPDFVERALTGLIVFLTHNMKLLTADVTSRLGDILYNFWNVIEAMPQTFLLRRRLLQCYDHLLASGRLTKYPSSLLMKFAAHISVPETYTKEEGVHIESAMTLPKNKSKSKESAKDPKFNQDSVFETSNAMDSGILSCKYDNRASLANDIDFVIYCSETYSADDNWVSTLPRDVYTTIVDLAVSVTSKLLPLQPMRIQESVFDAILANIENTAGAQSLRKVAVAHNVANFTKDTLQIGLPSEPRVLNVIISIIKTLLSNDSADVREIAASSCGIIAVGCKNDSNSSSVLASLIKELLEFTVSRSCGINLRIGSIVALGYIAQGRTQYSLFDALFKVFMQLAADPNPSIHIPVVASMRRSLMTAEFVDQKYVKCTLKTIALTYLLESHNNSLEFQREVAEGLVQVLSRTGPILSTDQQKANRDLIVCFADQLQSSSDPQVRVLAWKCFIEIYYYARQGISWPLLIKRWRDIIINPRSPPGEIDAAVNGLLILMRLSARSIISIAGPGFEDALWLLLDKKPDHSELRSLFVTWLDQTVDGDAAIATWIRTLSTVVMKPRYFFMNRLNTTVKPGRADKLDSTGKDKEAVNPTAIAADEDVALEVQSDDSSNEQFSWEARDFALEMLLHLLRLDLHGKDGNAKSTSVTTRMIGDIIKISFSSSTSQILGLQFGGLALLKEIIHQLSDLTDPDFPQISLLAQYQVQIISALSPAFGADSSPGLALAALHTCSAFITSDIIKTRDKLNRLIKILEDSLEAMKNKSFKLGKLETSADAARVLKVEVLSVWAQLFNYSPSRPFLQEIVEPHLELLSSLWTESIYEFGKMNSVLELQWSLSTLSSAVDQMKETQLRSLMQPVYNLTWLSFVKALSTVDSQDDNFRLVLCGLCFHALLDLLQTSNNTLAFSNESFPANAEPVGKGKKSLSSLASDESNFNSYLYGVYFTRDHTLASTKLSVLEVLQGILTPNTCEQVMKSTEDYFDEMVPILYRAMLVGHPAEQVAVLKIAHAVVTGQAETDDSVDHFFEILKISILPLKRMFPQLFDQDAASSETPHKKLDSEQISLLHHTMDTVIDIAQVFREVIQNDLWLCLLKVFEELNHYEPVVVAPSFKRLLEILATQVEVRGVTFVVGALTIALKRAVHKESTTESLLISTAIICTNSRSLYGPDALLHVQEFGQRAGDALLQGSSVEASEPDRSAALTAIQCITAVLRVCSDAPTGATFAYACLPSLVHVSSNGQLVGSDFGRTLVKQAAMALSIYAALDGTLESLAVVIPALISVQDGSMRNYLLQLMTKHPVSFKQSVWQMDEDDRSTLQSVLAQPQQDEEMGSLSGTDEESEDEADEIALKSFA